MSGFTGFKEFLKETTKQEALEILSLSGTFDEDELKKAYRRASSKYHPDKGGSTEDMQKVNASYELLQKFIGTSVSSIKVDSNDEKFRDAAVYIRDNIRDSLDLNAYAKYFETLFNEPFSSNVKTLTPSNAEIDKLKNASFSTHPHAVYVVVEWSNKDSSKVFEISIIVTLASVINSKGIASSNIAYPMGVITYAFMDNRKVKITGRDYTHTNKNDVFTKPESIFPKTKLTKKKSTVFKKSDMISALKSNLKAETTGDYFMIPFKDAYLSVFRTTMRRQGMWSVSGVYNKQGIRWVGVDGHNLGFYTFPETEETLEVFKGIKDLTINRINTYLKTEYDRILG